MTNFRSLQKPWLTQIISPKIWRTLIWNLYCSFLRISASPHKNFSFWTFIEKKLERNCMAFHMSLFLHLALKLIEKKLHTMRYLPLFAKFQSDTQRESYDDFTKVTSLRWIFGACKNTDFHRSYLQKYWEPSSEIFTTASSGFQLHLIQISTSEPS